VARKKKPARLRPAGPPVLHKTSEGLKPYVAFLERELAAWPKVTAKPMFGLTAYYRGPHIFAALPRTRALESPDSVSYKLPSEKAPGAPGQGWKSIEIVSDADLRAALRAFERAYREAGKKK
jgi:hypothetical protein